MVSHSFYKYLIGESKENEVRLFSVKLSNRKEAWPNLKHGKRHLDMRKHLFYYCEGG